jgi:CO/xanthine dehydrogenase FAD-binding subunit
MVVAGATAVMASTQARQGAPDSVIALRDVGELGGWRRVDGGVEVGAMVTLAELGRPPIGTWFPGLADAVSAMGTPQVRNVATIGGNLCTGVPFSDAATILRALAADVVLRSPSGERVIGVDELVLTTGVVGLRADEILVAVRVPLADAIQVFAKVGRGQGYSRTVAACALVAARRGTHVRCVLSDGLRAPVRARAAERSAVELLADPGDAARWPMAVDEIGRWAAAEAAPAGDVEASAEYRQHVLAVLVGRALQRVLVERGVSA